MIEDYWANAAYSVTPTILVGLIFWLIMRSILRADRTERKIFADMETRERDRRGLAARDAAPAVQSPASAPTSSHAPASSPRADT